MSNNFFNMILEDFQPEKYPDHVYGDFYKLGKVYSQSSSFFGINPYVSRAKKVPTLLLHISKVSNIELSIFFLYKEDADAFPHLDGEDIVKSRDIDAIRIDDGTGDIGVYAKSEFISSLLRRDFIEDENIIQTLYDRLQSPLLSVTSKDLSEKKEWVDQISDFVTNEVFRSEIVELWSNAFEKAANIRPYIQDRFKMKASQGEDKPFIIQYEGGVPRYVGPRSQMDANSRTVSQDIDSSIYDMYFSTIEWQTLDAISTLVKKSLKDTFGGELKSLSVYSRVNSSYDGDTLIVNCNPGRVENLGDFSFSIELRNERFTISDVRGGLINRQLKIPELLPIEQAKNKIIDFFNSRIEDLNRMNRFLDKLTSCLQDIAENILDTFFDKERNQLDAEDVIDFSKL